MKTSVEKLFADARSNQDYLKVCAPMVRYSKVQFRTLVRNYGVDLCFTPMILADSFCQNSKARNSEFSTTQHDTPLIVQFAANNPNDFVDASSLIYPYADGVDLNCGCPQRWAMKDGYGSALLSKPQVIYDLVRGVRNTLPIDFSVSVKIRILSDLTKTINMCQQMEKCGVTFLTVHGRTPSQKSGDEINVDALKEVCSAISVPIVANGGIRSLHDADVLYQKVKCSGIMAASSMLSNPALFSGAGVTPVGCVKQWMALKDRNPERITFQCYHHHLVFMLDKYLTKPQKQEFNCLKTFDMVDNYLVQNVLDQDEENIQLAEDDFVNCSFSEDVLKKHSKKCRNCGKSIHYCVCSDKYDSEATDGSFYKSYVNNDANELDYMDSNMFDEYR